MGRTVLQEHEFTKVTVAAQNRHKFKNKSVVSASRVVVSCFALGALGGLGGIGEERKRRMLSHLTFPWCALSSSAGAPKQQQVVSHRDLGVQADEQSGGVPRGKRRH